MSLDSLKDPYRRRWFGWTMLVLAFFLVSLHRTSTAVLSERLMQAFDTTATSLGLLHSSFFYLYAAFQVPAGLLTDRYGVRTSAATGTVAMAAPSTPRRGNGQTVNGTRVYSTFGYKVAFAISAAAGLVAIVCAIALHRRVRAEGDEEPAATVAPTD